MQPSEYEIQREVEALRDLRRRSTAQGGPGTLIIDPDLPNQSTSSTSPTTSYWPGSPPSLTDDESALSSLEDISITDHSPNNPADDPFHLFWVPASVHPEIAPAEFRAFLKEHAADGTAILQRSNSSASTSSSLGRKKSMLSRQYRPFENDGVENEEVVPVKRRSSIYTNVGPQLTINDLEKLELLAEEASRSDDPSKLRNILRRSLSLNVSPSVLDEMDDLPDMADEDDSPIIVPPPGQILRRAARTKIRKPGLPGDGGGHRFGSSRRTARPSTASSQTLPLQRNSTSSSSSDHGDTIDAPRPRAFSNESFDGDAARRMLRPESYSEETSIYDAYANQEDESEEIPLVVTSPPPLIVDLPIAPPPPESEPVTSPVVVSPMIHQPRPQRYLVPPPQPEPQSPRTPSPEEQSAAQVDRSPTNEPPSVHSSPTSPSQQRKDKDKKGLFGKWGGDKNAKKTNKERERENRERAEKEKEGGFLSTFFGGSKKKQEEPAPSLMAHSPTAGREAAQALLGASKSYVPPSSPHSPGPGTNSYARYPIHVERAIYRLSHIKLANPRRPLYEQVLISNLMFWYLGVINKSPATTPSPTGTGANAKADGTTGEKEQKEKEQREREERQKAEKEKERMEKEREMEQKRKESPRRGSLTKPLVAGAMPSGGRRAEMPIRGPQYEMQHRVIEQEYNGYNGQPGYQPGFNGPAYMGQPAYNPLPGQQGYNPQPGFDMQIPDSLPMSRAASAPASPVSMMQQPLQQQPQMAPYPPMQQQPDMPPMPGQQQPLLQVQVPGHFYYGGPGPDQQPRVLNPPLNLPPGAMPPMAADQPPWLASPSSSSPRMPVSPILSSSPYPPGRRQRSPPPSQRQNNPMPMELEQGGKIPARSMSATVHTSPAINGKPRKGVSAYAVPKGGRRPRTADSAGPGVGAEEDVPLALWQQQRRK